MMQPVVLQIRNASFPDFYWLFYQQKSCQYESYFNFDSRYQYIIPCLDYFYLFWFNFYLHMRCAQNASCIFTTTFFILV